MSMTSIGDLSRSLMMRSHGTQLKQRIATLTQELSSGRAANPNQRLGGDFAYLSDIERGLTRLEGFSIAAVEARNFAQTAQNVLGTLSGIANNLGSALVTASSSQLETARQSTSARARADLETAISALNSTIAGRSLFAGTATDTTPIASVDQLLSGLKAALGGATTVPDILSASAAWFDGPGGFRAAIYQGGDTPLAAFRVDPAQQVSFTTRADDPALAAVLESAALAALATDPDLSLDADAQADLLRAAGEGLFSGQPALLNLQATLGYAQERIEEAETRNASARMALDTARSSLLGADPYETAIRLEEAQFRLETLYTVTVRNSNLTLLNFLK